RSLGNRGDPNVPGVIVREDHRKAIRRRTVAADATRATNIETGDVVAVAVVALELASKVSALGTIHTIDPRHLLGGEGVHHSFVTHRETVEATCTGKNL